MGDTKPFRQGVKEVSDFLPTPCFLAQKSLRKVNILIGYSPAQVRFVTQYLDQPCEPKEQIHDEDVIGKEALYQVSSASHIDLSPNVREKAGLWTLDTITEGSAGAHAIVKYAAKILGKDKISREQVSLASKVLMRDDVDDVRATIWRAVWLLSGKELTPTVWWKEPWEDPSGWLPEGEDPVYRLNTLYRTLIAYTFIRRGEEDVLRKMGMSMAPFKVKKLKELKLDINKVEQSFYELSQWRSKRADPYVCALKLRNIWKG
jgi:hypothetical protein